MAARDLLNSFSTSQRLPKRQGNNRVRAALEDIGRLLLNPAVALPVFYAVNMSRLPPVDASHCDVSAILKELSVLRQEVRAVTQLREEVTQLRVMLVSKAASEVNAVNTAAVFSDVEADSNQVASGVLQPLYSKIHLSAHNSASTPAGILRKKQPVRKPVVGASLTNTHVKAVGTTRAVDVFVSRLHPLTTAEELVYSVNSVKGSISVHEVKCVQLKSRYEALYSSYHVEIRVGADELQHALDLFMSAEAWPSGVFVRRYFKPKNGSRD